MPIPSTVHPHNRKIVPCTRNEKVELAPKPGAHQVCRLMLEGNLPEEIMYGRTLAWRVQDNAQR